MFAAATTGGVIAIILGILVLIFGPRSRGSMDVDIGSFKGPVWFLLFVIGIALIGLGYL